jgi:phospholipase/carboxylesterase
LTLSLIHRRREATRPPPGDRPPLLILLHGVGSNELSMAALAGSFDPRFVVLSVRSPIELASFSYGWFHVRFTPTGSVINAEEAEAGWKHLGSFIDEAVVEYTADPAQVYIAGFSQGGIMALAAMLTVPRKLAAVVCMSGRLLPEVVPHAASNDELFEKPVLIVHGTRDERLRVDYGRGAFESLKQFPLALDYREFDMPHTTTDESIAFVSGWLSGLLDCR